METYTVRLTLRLVARPPEALPAFAEHVFDELLNLDPGGDMTGPEEGGLYTFWTEVEAESPLEAATAGSATVRAAAHAAGGTTTAGEQWPEYALAQRVEAYVAG
jgi:hypothetical protein